MKYFYGIILSLANFCKRFYFINKSILLKIFKSYIWLFNSREHTSFSINLSENSKQLLIQNLQNDFCISANQTNEILNFSKNIKIKRPIFSIFNPKTVDVNFKLNFDYALLVLIFLKYTSTELVYEFGFNQARIPLLLNMFQKENSDFIFSYQGIDLNKRKGGLYQSQSNQNNENIDLLFVDTDYFLNNHFDSQKVNNSILISSTHENNSEEALFQHLTKNNVHPKIILSDKISQDSAYKKFIDNKNIYYSSVYMFEDETNVQNPIYIGVSKRLP